MRIKPNESRGWLNLERERLPEMLRATSLVCAVFSAGFCNGRYKCGAALLTAGSGLRGSKTDDGFAGRHMGQSCHRGGRAC